MFDVFHNVFGKKRPNSDHDRSGSDENNADRSQDDFVILGSSSNDRTAVKDTDVNPNDLPPPFQMFNLLNKIRLNSIRHGQKKKKEQLSVSDHNNLYPLMDGARGNARKAEPEVVNIMPLQGVPFKLNVVLNMPNKLDQIWQRVTPCLNSIVYPKSLELEYDFSVEKSVVS